MNQSINTDSKNSKEPQQKYRLGTVSIKILGGLNRFYGRPTSPSASVIWVEASSCLLRPWDAPYHATFSGRWVGSCLASFHACSKVLRQHRIMPSSQAQGFTPFMHRFHACSAHETAPYHASFSGRWVGSCLAPFHACSKVLRQHRSMSSSQASVMRPFPASFLSTTKRPWDCTGPCLDLKTS